MLTHVFGLDNSLRCSESFVAVGPDATKGCYLVFDIASEGSLFLHWSDTPVPMAVAYMQPRIAVPAFKYKANGGRSERDAYVRRHAVASTDAA